MAKISTQKLPSGVQNYPRLQDEPYQSCLDDTQLFPHSGEIRQEDFARLVARAISDANAKSRRVALSIPADADDEVKASIYQKAGRDLFKYFKDYCGDPASTAYQLNGKSCRDVGEEQFRLSILQKERMNSAWRYQYLALYGARASGRFENVSDSNQAESDFTAVIHFRDEGEPVASAASLPLNIYVSVKNRENTHGGQDWPKAISALEQAALTDKNRRGAYLCVFGFAMDGGHSIKRRIRRSKDKRAMSPNTEMWYADFFWPFFTALSYEEVMQATLAVLAYKDVPDQLIAEIGVPDEVVDAFAERCVEYDLVDDFGIFHDPYRLVHFFCSPLPKTKRILPPRNS